MRETWVRSLGQEDSPGEGNGTPLQYSCLEIPWTEEPGGLNSPLGSQRVGHDWATSLSLSNDTDAALSLKVTDVYIMNKTPSLMTSSDLYLVRDPLNLTNLCPTEVLLEVCEGRASESHLDLGRAWSLIGYSPWGSQRVGHDWATSLSLSWTRHMCWVMKHKL